MDQANRRRFPAIVAFPYCRHALSQTEKSSNRFNPPLPSMMNRLKPGTIYYFRVESVDALDIAEGPESPISQFTTEQSP
jgi:hypothetical protein